MGGRIIRDATALPEDVKEGKIFYNNKGRQMGTGVVGYSKQIKIPAGELTYQDKQISYNRYAQVALWANGNGRTSGEFMSDGTYVNGFVFFYGIDTKLPGIDWDALSIRIIYNGYDYIARYPFTDKNARDVLAFRIPNAPIGVMSSFEESISFIYRHNFYIYPETGEFGLYQEGESNYNNPYDLTIHLNLYKEV